MSEKIKKRIDEKIALFEIVFFIFSIFSFAFVFSDYDLNSPLLNKIKNEKEFFEIIPSVSAQGISDLIGGGNSLEDVSNAFNSAAENIEGGNMGCCFDTDQGLCDPNVNKQNCEEKENGEFLSDKSCNVNECEIGCCVYGNNVDIVTSQRCIKLSELYGVPFQYKAEISDAVSCLAFSEGQSYGACVFGSEENEGEIIENGENDNNGEGENNCKFTTKEECSTSIGGIFHKDLLCSNEMLNSVCLRQTTTRCADGKDEIYWYDSCGNRENIYDSDKEKSWNNGKVLSKEESCNPNSDNTRSATCGNCNYNKGSICALDRGKEDKDKKDGDYVCRDLNCKDGLRIRQNGESWCLYDGQVGNGRDVVGSRHFRQLCVNGEIKTEPCADYRKEICVKEGGIGETAKDVTNQILGQFGVSLPDLSSIPGLSGIMGGGSGILSSLGGGIGGGLGLSPEENNNITNINETGSGNPDVDAEIDARNDLFGNNDDSGSGGIASTLQQSLKSQALCRPNMWEDCSGRNILTCSQNPDCKSKIVYISKDFYLLKCVPKYPPGMDLSKSGGHSSVGSGLMDNIGGGAFGDLSSMGGGLGGNSEEDICSVGSDTCVVVYEKKCPGGWKCVENCDCEKIKFTAQMNDYCTMLGDCGAKANIAGKVTDKGYSIKKEGGKAKKPPRLTGIQQIYAVFAKGGNLQGITGAVDGGFYNKVPGLSMIGNYGISMFGEGGNLGGNINSGASDNQLANMYSGDNIGGTIGGTAIGSSAGVIGSTAFGGSGIAGSSATFTGACLGSGVCIGLSPFGWGLVGGFIAVGLMYAMGCGKQEETEITFTCKAWTPPAMGNCGYCNNDPDKPCSKYRCESLGQNCKLINENTGQDECVSVDVTSGTPIISPYEKVLNESFSYTDVSGNGFRIRQADGECIQAFTPLVFGVKTNIPAYCRMGEEKGSFDELDSDFLEGGIYSENHTATTYLPSVESLIASEVNNEEEFNEVVSNQSFYNYLLDATGDINLYVKCQSVEGQENPSDYMINFCVRPGPDRTAPAVVATSPPTNSKVRYNATQWTSFFFINEPAECRWSLINEDWSSMTNNMDCVTDATSGTLFGYPCNATLPLTGQENKFYISCRDQPWLGETNSSRNIGIAWEYILKKTQTPLSINSISPYGNITRGSSPTSIELNVGTSGGYENGKSICEYSLNGNRYITFAKTLSNSHVQVFNSMISGEHKIDVRCLDEAGNIASRSTNFSLILDTKAPEVTRVYYENGMLKFITSEEAKCSYVENSPACGFRINSENSTKIDDYLSLSHSVEWDEKKVYSIKCEDLFGNNAGGCSIIAKPENIIVPTP